MKEEIKIYRSVWRNALLILCCLAFAAGGVLILLGGNEKQLHEDYIISQEELGLEWWSFYNFINGYQDGPHDMQMPYLCAISAQSPRQTKRT